jgi:hypothetical protein
VGDPLTVIGEQSIEVRPRPLAVPTRTEVLGATAPPASSVGGCRCVSFVACESGGLRQWRVRLRITRTVIDVDVEVVWCAGLGAGGSSC